MMSVTLVTYRTSDYRYNQHAVVPTSWLSDLLKWLTLSECAEVVSVAHNLRGLSDLVVPDSWPSYQTCSDYIRVSDILGVR